MMSNKADARVHGDASVIWAHARKEDTKRMCARVVE